MHPIEFTVRGESFHLEGFPNAEKSILLTDSKSKWFADLGLHRSDLNFANECLGQISQSTESGDISERALWITAISHFIKCFQHNEARRSLDKNIVLNNDPDALEAFKYYKNLRDKNYIHDENSMSQSIPLAILNKRGDEYKIAKIVATIATGLVSIKEARINFTRLLGITIQWVITEYDRVADEITADLESKDYDELFQMDSPIYNVPKVEDISTNRHKL